LALACSFFYKYTAQSQTICTMEAPESIDNGPLSYLGLLG
jgi:hypothetical protein